MRSDLSLMAQAFGVDVDGLAKIAGFSRGGLYGRTNTHQRRLNAARKALKRHSYNMCMAEITSAKKSYETREEWIEKMFGGAENV